MKTKLVLITIILTLNIGIANSQYQQRIFTEEFDGNMVSVLSWFFPYWFSSEDGTFFGQTQTSVAQNTALPSIQNGESYIDLKTYNKTGPGAFNGTDLLARKLFYPGKGLIFTVRARMKDPIPSGIVGGIYLYNLTVPGKRSWYAIASSSDGTKLSIAVVGGNIWTSTSSGITWTEQNMTGPYNWQDIASSGDGNKLAAVVNMGKVWTSTNSGVTWTEQSGSVNNWTSIASSLDGTKLVATSLRENIWTSTNSGITWTSHPSAGYRNWYDVASSSDGTKLAAVVYSGGIWTSSDAGVTWIERTSAGSNNWNSIASSADGTKLAVCSAGTGIWTSTDSGATWTRQTSADSPSWTSIASSSDGTKLAAMGYYAGNVWTSTNSGVDWVKRTGPALNSWNAIASSSDGTKLAAIVFGGNIWTSTNSGVAWANQSGANQTLHDEIDFELLTKDKNKVHFNVYSNEPMGVGRPDSIPISTPITEYHIYTIEWRPSGITWRIDGDVVHTSSIYPKGPMRVNLNMWVPDASWRAAYNSDLHWTNVASENQTYSMLVDYVRVDSLTDISTSVVDVEKPDVSFYPNPVHDIIHFNSWENISVSIYNISGNAIIERKKITNGSLSVANLLPGLYIVRCEKNGITKNSKLIIR
jgi:photosystem II stability/assembly factor-like uncharacterized protein